MKTDVTSALPAENTPESIEDHQLELRIGKTALLHYKEWQRIIAVSSSMEQALGTFEDFIKEQP